MSRFIATLTMVICVGLFAKAGEDEKSAPKAEDRRRERLTDEDINKLIDEYQELHVSPKDRIKLSITAPRTASLEPSEQDPKVLVATIECDVMIENIGKNPFPYRPLLIDVAVCDESGPELPPGEWRWRKVRHGDTATINLPPGKSVRKPVELYFAGDAAKPGRTVYLVATYLNLAEGKYAIRPVKLVYEKTEKESKVPKK
jgi:hypothetical protein